MKVDVHNYEQRYLNWKDLVLEEGILGLTQASSEIIIQHVIDMEKGRNISGSKKGGRSYARLCNITQRLSQIARMLQDRGVTDLRCVSEEHISDLFSDMQRGIIKTYKGKPYRSTGDYVKVFKTFWHWWQKTNRKEGRRIIDITEDLSSECVKSQFVYLTKGDLDRLLPYFELDRQVLLLFLFDSIIRSPTEVLSLRVSNVEMRDGEIWVNVPEEISKTIGRSFNLLYCGEELLAYIKRNELKPNDPLFIFSPSVLNRQLQEAARQEFGERLSHSEGDYYHHLTLYDFRHSGAIHFRILAKENPHLISLDAIRHRGGWTDFKMLNYYTQFIGMDGKIDKQGMMLRQDKHYLELEVEKLHAQIADVMQFVREFKENVKHIKGQRHKD